jgi:hypothetical protein
MKRELYTALQIRRKRSLLQQTPKIPEKRNLQLSEKRSPSESQGPGPADPENSTAYFPDERMDTGRKEERGREKASCSFRSSALKGERKKDRHDHRTILPRRPPHRESGVAPRLRRRADRAQRRTTSAGIPPTEKPAPKHSATPRAGERDPEQPVSRDEVSEIGETPEERVFRERRNSRRRDRRRVQEQAEQDARQRRKNPLFGRNLNPDFARAMNTPSEVGGVLARIADGLPRTPDAEGYRRLFTQAANHLLPLAHPPNDLRHAINSRRDARSSINASRERWHENEIRRREEYDRIMASQLEARPPELSRQRPQLAVLPGDGRGTTTTTPLPGTDIIPDDRRTRVECLLLLHALGPSNGPLTSRYPMSINMNLSRIQGAG